MNKRLNKLSVTVVAFRERTFGHLRHQNSSRCVPPAYNLCPGDHPAEVQPVISPPASEGAVSPAPALRRRNWSCRMEAAGAGPDGVGTDAEEDPSVCRGAAPPLVPGNLEGPGCAAARALGGMGLGGRGRPPLWGHFRWQDSGSPLVGRMCRRLMWPSLLEYPLIAGLVGRGDLYWELPLQKFLCEIPWGSYLYLSSLGDSV